MATLLRRDKTINSQGQKKGSEEAKRYYFKAQEALKTGKWIKAIQYLNQSVEVKEDYLPALRQLAEIYQQHGNVNNAQECIKKALEINQNDPISLFIQGVITLNDGNIMAALEFFEKSRQNGELTWGLAYNIGLCYYSMENFEISTVYLNSAIQKDPTQPQPYLLLAQILIKQNKKEVAKKILTKAKRMRPFDQQLDLWINDILNPEKLPKG